MTPALPPVPAPFGWRDGQIAIDLPGGHGRFTTRAAAGIGEAGQRIAQSEQVHGAHVRSIRAEQDLDGPAGAYDAQLTTLDGVACAVRVADCLPIVLIAPEAVGAVHGGWRGLAAGVLQASVDALHACGASEIRAAIGPGARVCCYEAGDEVHAAFADVGAGARQGSHADLAAVATTRLWQAGVGDIHDTGLCTICAQPGLLWSFRREGAAAGHQGGVAWRS